MSSGPRVAMVHGTLRVPPTYFTIQQAIPLQDRYDFTFFALAAQVEAGECPFPVLDVIPRALGSFRRRELLIPLGIGRLDRAIRRRQPNLVHQQFGTWSRSARLAASHSGVPLLGTVHGSDVFTIGHRGRDPRYKWHRSNVLALFAEAKRVLCVSRFLADEAVRAGAAGDRVEVHYQGVDTDFFSPGATVPDGVPRVVFVGRLAEYKGVTDLVAAASRLWSRGVEHELVLVGDGPLRAELARRAAAEPGLRVVGPLSKEGVRAQLRGAHVLVLPSTPREAAGLVLLEAQACGVPVVAYDGGGKPEMLRPDRTGRLARQGDVADLAASLEAILLLDATGYRAMAEAARAFVVAERSLDASANQLGQHYADLMG